MAWDQKILPDAFLNAALSAAGAAADGARESAYMTHVQTGIGTSWKRQLLRDDVVVYEGTGTGLLPFVGRTFTIPGVTKSSISNADIDTGEWVHRIIHASDATKYIAGLVTKTGGAGPGFLTDDLVSPNDVDWGTFTATGPVLDSLSITLGTPASVTTSSFTLSATIAGSIPPGAVMIMQWIDNRASGVWRESPQVTAVPGVYTVAFTGAPADTLITWRVFVFTAPDTIHAQSQEGTFRTVAAVSSGWLDALRDSMSVRNVTERWTYNPPEAGGEYWIGRIIRGDNRAVPFPDSYVGYTSHAGIEASLVGRSTGLGSEVSSYTGWPGTVAPRPIESPNILHFSRGVDACAVWSWFSTKTGHASTQTKIHVSDMFFGILRESTRTWETLFTGMRVAGGSGNDLTTDPNTTILTLGNNTEIEAWCATTASNPGNFRNFFGRVDRALFADSRTWVMGVKVRLVGPDMANARYVGLVGCDHHRSDYYGDRSRSWPSGYPAYVADSGGAEWNNIRTDGADQWLLGIGCFELVNFQGNRPPWGSWGGTWPYSSPPLYGPSWAEIQGNPPPDYRV
jgi:hypothetical protein